MRSRAGAIATASSNGASSPSARLCERAAVVAVVEHSGDVRRHTLHAARADRFDPRLLDRVKQRARRRTLRREAPVKRVAMTSEPQGERIGEAPDDRGLARIRLARRLGQSRFGALRRGDERGFVRRERDFEPGLTGQSAGPQEASACLNGSFGVSALPAGLRLLVGLTSTVDIRDLRKEDTAEKARVVYRPCAEAAARTAPLKTPGKNGIDSGRVEALGLTIRARREQNESIRSQRSI